MIDVVYNPNGPWINIQEVLILLTMLFALFLGVTLLVRYPKMQQLQLPLIGIILVGLVCSPLLAVKLTLGHLKPVDTMDYETYITSDNGTPVLRITSKNKEIPTDQLMFRVDADHSVTLTNQLLVRENNQTTIDVKVEKTLPKISSKHTKWLEYTVDKSKINYQTK